MKRVSISGSLRENVGKKDANKQRSEEKVVCVLYGGEKQVHFTIDEKQFKRISHTPDVYIVDLSIGGEAHSAILQAVQFHPVSDKPLHADFLEILDGRPIKVVIPVRYEGAAPGVLKGGILNKKLRNIPVKGFSKDIPENFVISISKLKIGMSIKIKDINFGPLTPLMDGNSLVVGVKATRGAIIADDEEEEEAEA
jgi:large subunit ribosomal protein L25